MNESFRYSTVVSHVSLIASAAICRTVIRWPTHQLSLCGAACRNEPAAVWLGDHRGRDDGALTAPRRAGRYRPAVLSNRHKHWLHQLEIALSLDTV